MYKEIKEKHVPFLTGEQKPREKLIQFGAEKLSDSELLAILIGSGTKRNSVYSIAPKLLKTLDGGDHLKLHDITQINGIGRVKGIQIMAALEFARRRLCPASKQISFPQDVLPLVTHYADRRQEHFLCLSLNGAHEVMALRVVSIGLLNRTIVHPREVFADPLIDRAAAVIIAHNHPSGQVAPSKEDREITKKLKTAGVTLGINLLDHIIFSTKGHYSFLEHGAI